MTNCALSHLEFIVNPAIRGGSINRGSYWCEYSSHTKDIFEVGNYVMGTVQHYT